MIFHVRRPQSEDLSAQQEHRVTEGISTRFQHPRVPFPVVPLNLGQLLGLPEPQVAGGNVPPAPSSILEDSGLRWAWGFVLTTAMHLESLLGSWGKLYSLFLLFTWQQQSTKYLPRELQLLEFVLMLLPVRWYLYFSKQGEDQGTQSMRQSWGKVPGLEEKDPLVVKLGSQSFPFQTSAQVCRGKSHGPLRYLFYPVLERELTTSEKLIRSGAVSSAVSCLEWNGPFIV